MPVVPKSDTALCSKNFTASNSDVTLAISAEWDSAPVIVYSCEHESGNHDNGFQGDRLLNALQVNLEVTDDALRAVAHQALKHKTGARGLRAIMVMLTACLLV